MPSLGFVAAFSDAMPKNDLSPLPRRLGMIYQELQQPQQALGCLQAIADEPPAPLTQADVWFLIGDVQEKMEPPAPTFAKGAYEHVLSLLQSQDDPKAARVYRQLGWVCHKWQLAPPLIPQLDATSPRVLAPLLCMLHAVKTDPADASAWHVLAKTLFEHSELGGAYDCLSHAIRIDPSAAEFWRTLSQVYLAKAQAVDAVAACEHAVHLDSQSAAWFELGVARHALLAGAADGAGDGLSAHAASRADPTAVAQAVEAYTHALTFCKSEHGNIVARLKQLHAIQAAQVASAKGSMPRAATQELHTIADDNSNDDERNGTIADPGAG